MIDFVLIGGEQKHQSIRADAEICTCLCSSMGTGGGYIPMILYNEELPLKWYDVDNEVSVRKYEVDVKGLVKLLRQHKTLSNKEIAEKLDVTLTTVEHWFRQDKSFTVPDPNNWIKLKELLDIKDTSFDKSIMTFETKEGNFDKAKRIFDSNYLSPTILANDTEIKIISKV